MKILGTTPIPTEKLFELRKECEALHARISDLLQLSYIYEPKEASSEAPQKAEQSAKPNAAADENLNGMVVHKAPTKPFEMILE